MRSLFLCLTLLASMFAAQVAQAACPVHLEDNGRVRLAGDHEIAEPWALDADGRWVPVKVIRPSDFQSRYQKDMEALATHCQQLEQEAAALDQGVGCKDYPYKAAADGQKTFVRFVEKGDGASSSVENGNIILLLPLTGYYYVDQAVRDEQEQCRAFLARNKRLQ